MFYFIFNKLKNIKNVNILNIDSKIIYIFKNIYINNLYLNKLYIYDFIYKEKKLLKI